VGTIDRIKSKLAEYRPRIGSAYLNYIDLVAADPEYVELDEHYTHEVVESSSNPLFAKVAPPWQRKVAAEKVDNGDWYVLVIMHDGEVIGHFWAAVASTRGLMNGIMNLELVEGEEAYGFDLYLHPDHRRGKVGNWVAWLTITGLRDRGLRWGYTHVLVENVPSIFWHHGVGFNILQSFNYFNFGPRIWWKLPKSETPLYGPLSRKGRHNDPQPADPFGGSFFPQ
jgi:GNAT superfamily N-acetyltransferase